MPTEKKFDKVKYDNQFIKNNYDRLNFLMPKGTKEQIQAAADLEGISSSEWVRQAILDKLYKP